MDEMPVSRIEAIDGKAAIASFVVKELEEGVLDLQQQHYKSHASSPALIHSTTKAAVSVNQKPSTSTTLSFMLILSCFRVNFTNSNKQHEQQSRRRIAGNDRG